MKNLENEYKSMIHSEIPDLWSRIEAALPEKEIGNNTTPNTEKTISAVSMQTFADADGNIENKKNSTNRKNKNAKKNRAVILTVTSVLSACACGFIAFSVYLNGNKALDSMQAPASVTTITESKINAINVAADSANLIESEDFSDEKSENALTVSDGIFTTDSLVRSDNEYYSLGDEELDENLAGIVDEIVTADMSDVDKAEAIYDWIQINIRYGTANEADLWTECAEMTIEEGKGDCYSFCCISRALLTFVGIENVEVVSNAEDHYWVLVHIDKGDGMQWYHWDATPGWGEDRFLWTDEEMADYEYENSNLGSTLSYEWDASQYPY